jgi:murein DD-endopeptidase MepM/ murein hydrolase activator NlpD
MIFPINPSACPGIPINHHPGAFGFHRPWNYHPGVDLYTNDNEEVYPIEDGVVVSTGLFTGPDAGSSWWETTWYIMVEGRSGVFNYGEVRNPNIPVGTHVIAGECIANIKRVLFEDKLRPNIPGHSTSMLHLELYAHGSIQPVEWVDRIKPKHLLDPTPIILPIWLQTQSMTNFQWDNSI